MTTVLRGT